MGKSCWMASLPYKSSYNISKFQLLLLVLEFPMLQTSNLAVFLYIPLYVPACASASPQPKGNSDIIEVLSLYIQASVYNDVDLHCIKKS